MAWELKLIAVSLLVIAACLVVAVVSGWRR
jgi:hypothetical protein